MKKLKFFFYLFVYGSLTCYGQQSLSANVVAEFQYSSHNNIYFLYESSNDEYYKSTLTNVELDVNDKVQIWLPANQDSLFLIEEGNSLTFYAKKISDPVTQIPQEVALMLPVLEDSILFFDSKEHLAELYNLTDDYLSQISPDSTSIFLDKIERLYGTSFLSYRKYFAAKYPEDSSYTLQQIHWFEKEDFISDEILKTYFNRSRLLGIGDSVYYYNDRKSILSIQKENSRGITYLKTIAEAKDRDLTFSVFEIPMYLIESNEITYLSKDMDKGKVKGLFTIHDGPENISYNYQTIPILINNKIQCNPLYKGIAMEFNVALAGNAFGYYSYYSLGYNVKLTIDWGDGSPLQVIPNYYFDGNPSTTFDEIYHTYPLEANYNVVTSVEFYEPVTGQMLVIDDGDGYPMSPIMTFECHVTCTDNDVEESKEIFNASNNIRLSAKGWINHNIFGNHIGGYTHGYEKVGGNWKRFKSKIYIKVDGVFREIFDCNLTETKTGSKEHNNDKKIQKVKTKFLTRYKLNGNGDVKTNHKLQKNGTTLETTITLNPC